MPNIHLYGALKNLSAEPIEAEVADMRDVISAMKVWFPSFVRFMHDHPDFNVVLTGTDGADPRAVHTEFFNAPFADDVQEIHLFPAAEGAGPPAFLIAAIGAAAAAVVWNVVISLAIGVVMQMLAPKPKMTQSERADEQPSFLFNGPENVQEQGYQVPVVYGTHMTGSVIVSAGVTVKHINLAASVAAAPTPAPATEDQWSGQGDGQ